MKHEESSWSATTQESWQFFFRATEAHVPILLDGTARRCLLKSELRNQRFLSVSEKKHSEPSIVVCAISTLLCVISLEQVVF